MSEAAAETVPLARLFARAAPAAAVASDDPAPHIDEALEAAFQEGHASASAELAPTIELLRTRLAEAAQQRDSNAAAAQGLARQLAAAIEARFARELAALSLAAAEAVLKTRPGLEEATLESLIAEAVGNLGGGTLFLAPDLVERARSLAPPGWSVAGRDGLATDTVEAEAGAALQRASLSGRLEQLLDRRP